jgi:hypothetical protein
MFCSHDQIIVAPYVHMFNCWNRRYMYIVLFSCARTGAQPPQQSTPSANYRNRVNIQRDRAGASSDDEHQQVLQQIL